MKARATGRGSGLWPGLLMKTQMGWAAAAARDGRIVATSLSRTRAAAVSDLGVAVDFARPDDLLRQLAGDLEEYFAGESVDFGRYEVDISGRPPFLRRALRAARRIPRGQVRSYAWLAAAAGNPRAARAAGQAMARNPAPIIIPCHRVIASDGSLGGFGGGLEMKRRLLALEGALLEAVGVRRPRQTRPTQTHCALGAAVPRGGRRRSHSAEPTPP